MVAAISRSQPLLLPVTGGTLDAALETDAGALLEQRAGDACSALGVLGAAALVVNHRFVRAPKLEQIGTSIVGGSVASAAVDATIQTHNLFDTDEEQRTGSESTVGSTVYAATGLIPGASLGVLAQLRRMPSSSEAAGLGLVAVNSAMLGYELVHRVPRIANGEEDASGAGSLLASLGGFVVAQRALR